MNGTWHLLIVLLRQLFRKLSFLIFSIFFAIEDEDPFLSLQDQDFQVFADERKSRRVSSDIKLGTRNFIASILFLWIIVSQLPARFQS